jgi:hypothetical protein
MRLLPNLKLESKLPTDLRHISFLHIVRLTNCPVLRCCKSQSCRWRVLTVNVPVAQRETTFPPVSSGERPPSPPSEAPPSPRDIHVIRLEDLRRYQNEELLVRFVHVLSLKLQRLIVAW